MADLTPIEQLELDRCFGMVGGYVLGFSNRTLAAFMLSTSKANRLHAFGQLEPNGTVDP